MKIISNLHENWKVLILREIDILKTQGIIFSKFNKNNFISFEKYIEHLITEYFHFTSRIISNKKRKIKIPKDFKPPPHLEYGYKNLINKVEAGEDLFSHLSRQMKKANFFDGLLFDWNIFHFHLGFNEDKKYKSMVEGTKEVLYAVVTDEYFYILDISDHNWANRKYLEVLEENYPQLLKIFEVNNLTPEKFSTNDIIHLRKNGLNYLTELNGKGYKFGPMYSTSRLNMLGVLVYDKTFLFFELVTKFLNNNSLNIEKAIFINFKKNIVVLHLILFALEEESIILDSIKYHLRLIIKYEQKKENTIFKEIIIRMI